MKKLALLIVLIPLLGCVEQGFLKEETTKVFEDSLAAGITSLDFETFNGYIKVQFWDQQTYKIEVKKRAYAITSKEAREKAESILVDFPATGTTLALKVQEVKYAGADIMAYLPRKSFDTADLSTSNGHIEVEELTASTVSLVTSNGYIKAYVTAESIQVETSNGRIEGFFQGNDVNIETSNAMIDVTCGDGGDYTLETSNGRIDLQAGARGTFNVMTSNGSITMTVAGDFGFDLTTSNGTINVEAARVTYTLEEKDHKKGFTSDQQEVSITASTSNSSVTVTKT